MLWEPSHFTLRVGLVSCTDVPAAQSLDNREMWSDGERTEAAEGASSLLVCRVLLVYGIDDVVALASADENTGLVDGHADHVFARILQFEDALEELDVAELALCAVLVMELAGNGLRVAGV